MSLNNKLLGEIYCNLFNYIEFVYNLFALMEFKLNKSSVIKFIFQILFFDAKIPV